MTRTAMQTAIEARRQYRDQQDAAVGTAWYWNMPTQGRPMSEVKGPAFVLPPGSVTSLTACLEGLRRPELHDEQAVITTLCGPMGRVVGA